MKHLFDSHRCCLLQAIYLNAITNSTTVHVYRVDEWW